ncbi:uncharacterized protein METZ01_LOCUS491783, partial [marine metagenome]
MKSNWSDTQAKKLMSKYTNLGYSNDLALR